MPKTVVTKPNLVAVDPVKLPTPQERVDDPRDTNYPAIPGFTAFQPDVSKKG